MRYAKAKSMFNCHVHKMVCVVNCNEVRGAQDGCEVKEKKREEFLNQTQSHQKIPQTFPNKQPIHKQVVKNSVFSFLSKNCYFPGVIMIIFLSCGISRQCFSQLFFLDPWLSPRNNHYVLNGLRHIKGLHWRFYCALQSCKVIFRSCFPNTCVMTRKASDPRHLKEGYRCALEIGSCCAKCHCLQL